MLVMKFGGSSVKDATAVNRVADIISARLAEHPVIVVSALGRTTDMLEAILADLEAGRADGARGRVEAIRAHHRDVASSVIAADDHRRSALDSMEETMTRLDRLVEGMELLGEVSDRSRDAVLSVGELASAPMLAAALRSRGLDARHVDPRDVILTGGHHGAAVPEMDECGRLCNEILSPMIEKGVIAVLGGFVGRTPDGVTTTLGRGGSDLTASVVARGLGAASLHYYKDVDGILTADPGTVPEARPVRQLTFLEAAELAFLGARVLHPASIQPAVDADIPVRVLNSYRPEASGTLITRTREPGGEPSRQSVVSVACKRDQLLLNVYSTRMLGASGFLRRVFDVFEKLEISVDHIATSEVNVSVTLAPTGRTEELVRMLGEVAAVRIHRNMGVVSVVGERIAQTPGVAASIFQTLRDVNIHLITYGGSGINVSFVIDTDRVPDAVRRLHSALFTDTGN